MNKKIVYPDRKRGMLVVRNCTVGICNEDNSAAIMLSTLLFWHDNPRKGDIHDKDTFTVCRTQADIEQTACHQINVKTIHDRAVPLLQMLGYLTVKEKMNGNIYSLNMEAIVAAFAAYEKSDSAIRVFLVSQLENSLIGKSKNELEKILINKKTFQLELENFLIRIRELSNCKRGRKPRTEAAPTPQNGSVETIETIRENSNREVIGASAPTNEPTELFPSMKSEDTKPGRQRRTEKPAAPPRQENKPEIVLTPEEQAVFDEWCKMRWFKGVRPALQKNDPEHLRKLAAYKPTSETMYKVKNWAKSAEVDRKGYYNKIGWSLYYLAKEYPRWLSTQDDQEQPAPTSAPAAPDPDRLVLWRRVEHPRGKPLLYWWLYELMPLSEAKQYNYRDIIPESDHNTILNKKDLLKRGIIKLPPEAAELRQPVA